MKILVSDIDSSISSTMNNELVSAINDFVSKGNMFIIATDKSINYIADSLALIDVNCEYYICNDGAVIFDRYFNVLFRKDIRQDVVRPIINMLDDDDNILEIFVDTSHGFVKDPNAFANGIVARPYDKLKAEALLNKVVLQYPSVHGNVNDNWLNIIDIDVNKCKALDYIKDTYRLNSDDIYVFGKDNTDLDIIKKYHGIIDINASEDLKTYANIEYNNLKEVIDYLMNMDKEVDE